MKEVVKYIAFDGSEFETRDQCEQYESAGVLDEIENLHKYIQRQKSGELKDEFRAFINAKIKFHEACTSKTPETTKLVRFENYMNLKKRYHESCRTLVMTRKKMNAMKSEYYKKHPKPVKAKKPDSRKKV